MQMDELVASGIGCIKLETACVVSSFGFRQQTVCACFTIEPKHAFEIEDVATSIR